MKKPILIVEDDPIIRESLIEILKDEGYPMLAATNGREGIDLLRKSKTLPGLVILDLMMPVTDGYGFRKEQTQVKDLASVPTAILSADGYLAQKAQSIGISEYLRKPVDLSQLFTLVEKYCG